MDGNNLHEQTIQYGHHANKYEFDRLKNPLKSTFIHGYVHSISD